MAEQRLLAALDQPQVLRRFARAAQSGYVDPLSRELAQRMQERLDYVRIDPKAVLDLGAGTGYCAAMLAGRYPRALLTLLDATSALLPPMTKPSFWQWLNRYRGASPALPLSLCADAANIPLANASQGLVWSNQLLPWVPDVSTVIEEIHRVLEPGGLFMFSTLGPDTLRQLDRLFDDAYPHRHVFPDMHDLGDLLGRSGFADPVVDMEYLTVEYQQLDTLVADLRRAGAGLAHPQRKRGLSGRALRSQLSAAWDRLSKNGRFAVEFEVVYGHAWRGEARIFTDNGVAPIRFHPKKPS